MGFAFKKNQKKQTPLTLKDIILPAHLGIIMDGNGRWPRKEACLERRGIRLARKISVQLQSTVALLEYAI